MISTTLEACVVDSALALLPPERISVSEAATKYRRLNNRGAFTGDWDNNETPYLVEPMDVLSSLDFSGMIFGGPSQCGKTDMFLNYLTHTVMADAGDLLLIHMAQDVSRNFSKTRVAKLHRDSPDVGRRLVPGRTNDAIQFKRYSNGSTAQFGWPAITQLSGKPISRVFFTDYDRMPQNIEGEGAPYSLGEARNTTYGRYGMCAAESSPGFVVSDPEWVPATAHQAPPTEGILSLYNRGDRRRWYWRCVRCSLHFEPDFPLMRWPDTDDTVEAGEATWLECPGCQARYREAQGDLPGRYALNKAGIWLRDGEKITPDGEIVGKPFRSRIASFWLKGPAASFGSWADKVTKYLDAVRKWEETGIETDIMANMNTVWGLPHTPKALEAQRLPEMLKSRAAGYGKKVVPPGVRFLIAAIDVQVRRFEVQVHGVGPGGDIWIVDRFSIALSNREDSRREGQVHQVKPFDEPRDWRLLLSQVLCATYPLSDGSGREMAVKGVVCDSGGGRGTTANAYAFWRWLRKGPSIAEDDGDAADYSMWTPDIYRRFLLFKGLGKRPSFRIRVVYPDSGKGVSDTAGALGEIPLLETATNDLKDQLDSLLAREDTGTGMIRYPDWLPFSFYRELCSETLDTKKNEWVKAGRRKNEAWDLLVMCMAFCLVRAQVDLERIDWTDPPSWAAPWDGNDLVFDPAKSISPLIGEPEESKSLADLAGSLA